MRIGDLIEERYRILKLLGEGGMGSVFLAQDHVLDRQVAIKTLLPQMVSDIRSVEQLKSEVRLSQKLRHENICATYDFRSGREPFIVMEYVEGVTLSNFIYTQPNHRCKEETFMGLARQILSAVEKAHSEGVIHRDLKCSNVMVTPDNAVRVMDFGIAANMRETHSRLTGSSRSLSLHYASPEQINGKPASVSMDIYSLGCIFYEMRSGAPPFHQGDILHQQLTRQPEPLTGVPARANEAILSCLSKKPAERPHSAVQVRAALEGDRTIRLGPRTWTGRAGAADRWPLSYRPGTQRAILAGGVCLALLGAAVAWFGSMPGDERTRGESLSSARHSGGTSADEPTDSNPTKDRPRGDNLVTTPPTPRVDPQRMAGGSDSAPVPQTERPQPVSHAKDVEIVIRKSEELLQAGQYKEASKLLEAELAADTKNSRLREFLDRIYTAEKADLRVSQRLTLSSPQ